MPDSVSGFRNTSSSLALVAAIAATGLGCGACHSARHASDRHGDDGQQALERVLRRVRSEYGVPALAAALVRGGRIEAAAVLGLRRIDQSDPAERDDQFHAGSVAKPMTATVVATIVEERLMSWQTTVAAVFPHLADRIQGTYLAVSLEQLLTHRAGLVAWEEDSEIALAPVVTGTATQQRRAAVAWLLTQPPVAAPGTEHHYSNAGYLVAAAMAEQVTGVAWEDLVRNRLAEPLGLTSLGFGWPARDDPAQPWGHWASFAGFVPHHPRDKYQAGPLLAPAGDVRLNITDLARFAQLHLEGLRGHARLLSPATFQKLHAPVGDYALGWNVRATANHHLGGMGTFLAAVWVSVPRNVAIVVMTNADANEGLVSTVINGVLRAFTVPRP